MQRNGRSILKIFVSSVQKELENERIAVTELVSVSGNDKGYQK
jgi:hypothetical protein